MTRAAETYPFRGRSNATSRMFSRLGVVSSLQHLHEVDGNGVLTTAEVGDLGYMYLDRRFSFDEESSYRIRGSAFDLNASSATTRAIFEAVERYAAAIVSESTTTESTARCLSERALDWRSFPVLQVESSDASKWTELPFDPDATIRWVRGYSPSRGEATYVPLPTVHIHFHPLRAERFTVPSSTGLAAHTSLCTAITNGLYETIEREAVEVVWRTRPSLREIEFDVPLSDEFRLLRKIDELNGVRSLYFDATTDLGVPVVYLVRQAPKQTKFTTIISAAAHHDIALAAQKCRNESSAIELTMRSAKGSRTKCLLCLSIPHRSLGS